jgi:predicted TIM-barrel fold metal-dependent hydrolase
VTTVEESLDWMISVDDHVIEPPGVWKERVPARYAGADIAIKYLGADNVMAESDYPHSDSSWPDSIRLMRKQLAHLSVPDQVKILRGNAERLFEFTPAPFPATSA